MKKLLILTVLIVLAGSALGQGASKAVRIKPDEMKWKANPFLPAGAQVTVLVGDPTKPGDVVVQRVKFPTNYRVPPHTHPYAEIVTVINGRLGFGMGEKFDTSKGEVVSSGTLSTVPAKEPHFVWTENEEAIVQVQFIGPGGIDYINPADDPRRKD
jgi:quercetin dioxygenase-like cupin family protein